MISYLKGTVAGIHKISSHRVILTLDVNQIGYDLQIPPRMVQELPTGEAVVQIFTHQQVREDQIILYGFASMAERDLFRQLISVSGIGAQLAIALLDTLGLNDLVQAIITENTKMLATTPGVGTKTAQRIALELKTKLAEWRENAGLVTPVPSGMNLALQEDVEMTLLAIGYTPVEVIEALEAISQDANLAKETDSQEWIRRAIAWLSS